MKYLNEDGLQVVADKINTRLKTVTEMPLTANDGAIRLYVGTDGTYLKGHIYKMVSGVWTDISAGGETADLNSSHGRGIWPRDVLNKVSRGLSRVEAG